MDRITPLRSERTIKIITIGSDLPFYGFYLFHNRKNKYK